MPNYAPVDVHAATYTVQRGDTVYNISKRFQINQNDLRTWNNIIDNNVKLGQVLRVKPAGYVAPPVTTNVTNTATTVQNIPAPPITPAPKPVTTIE